MKLMLGLCEFKLSMHLGAKKKFGVQVVYIMYIITNCLFKPLISLLSSFLVSYIQRSHTRLVLHFSYSQLRLLLFISILRFINIQNSRVAVKRPYINCNQAYCTMYMLREILHDFFLKRLKTRTDLVLLSSSYVSTFLSANRLALFWSRIRNSCRCFTVTTMPVKHKAGPSRVKRRREQRR